MRNKNSVKQLGKNASHRSAMFDNMITSLLIHERIVTTKQKGRVLKKLSERIITRAKRNLAIPESEDASKLHNKREVMKSIKNRDVIKKLFEDIAVRFRDRKGGYTRMYLLDRRTGDNAEMASVELVERVKIEPAVKADKKDKKTDKKKEGKKESKEKKAKK
ncbi:MAG: 50S ribosomal protein L17 [Spirochaetia bacterium]|jgi:large subunit ribosomal protein L17|nr:50S ribosomal protein L17 [Spirochaetia bacterium]